jgi:hypothetical protein
VDIHSASAELALEYEDLVTECEDLGSNRGGASKESGQRQKDRAKGRTHAGTRCSGPAGILDALGKVEFPGCTGELTCRSIPIFSIPRARHSPLLLAPHKPGSVEAAGGSPVPTPTGSFRYVLVWVRS